MQNKRENIFVSYCREDGRWLDKFQKMLAPLLREKKLEIWDDTKITPGTRWYQSIEDAVATSKVALLLVSAHFLASDFIMNIELPLLNAAREDGLKVLWVAVSRCMFQYTELKHEQALNDPIKPLDSLSQARLNDTMMDICWKIQEAMKDPLDPQQGPAEK